MVYQALLIEYINFILSVQEEMDCRSNSSGGIENVGLHEFSFISEDEYNRYVYLISKKLTTNGYLLMPNIQFLVCIF